MQISHLVNLDAFDNACLEKEFDDEEEKLLVFFGVTMEMTSSIGYVHDALGAGHALYAVAVVSRWVGAAFVTSNAVIPMPFGANLAESEDVGNAILSVMVASTRSRTANGNAGSAGIIDSAICIVLSAACRRSTDCRRLRSEL